MTTTQSWVEEFVEVAGAKTQVLKAGSGAPLLVLHGAGGNPGWGPYHEALSERFTVYAPSHPGYDKSERPGWVTPMKNVAHFYLALMNTLGLDQASLMGFFHGWLDSRRDRCYVHPPGQGAATDLRRRHQDTSGGDNGDAYGSA